MSTRFLSRDGWRVRWAAIGAAIAVTLGAGGLVIANAAPSSAPALFHALTPVRSFDTRDASGGVPLAPLGAGAQLDVTIGGTHGVPADASAVVLNVTVVDGTATSFLTAWPTGDPRPNASSLNWADSTAHPNGLTIGLGTAGKVSFYNFGGTVNVLADIVGYYTLAAGPLFQNVAAMATTSTDLASSIGTVTSVALALPDACPGVDHWTVRAAANGYFLTGSAPNGGATIGLNIDSSTAFLSGALVNQNLIGAGQLREVYSSEYLFTDVDSGTHTVYELGSTTVSVSVSPAQNRLIAESVAVHC
jgi:hypothetical protein